MKHWMMAAVALVLAGCSPGQSAQPEEIALMLGENSCAIACPQDSAFPGQRGSIECGRNFVPTCQCADPAVAIARCDRFDGAE